MPNYHLEKSVWSNDDFEIMGWHDATLWSMTADPEAFQFLVDLDYIFKWVSPGPGETYFKFWVAPVTMAFENAFDIKIDIESQQGSIEVADLHRELIGPSPNGKFTQYSFRFECREGEVSLQATGYKFYVRRPPTLLDHQSFSLTERGGLSVSKLTEVS